MSEDSTPQSTAQVAPASDTPANKSLPYPTLILTIAVSLLLGFLIAANLQQKKQNERVDLDAKKAELAARTANVNAERARLGQAPLEGMGSDSPEQIAARLTKDAATLANYADRFRTMLAEKNNSLLVSEQARQALSSQLARVQSQLDKAIADGASTELIRTQLSEAQSRLELYAGRPTEDEWLKAKTRIAELEAQLAATAEKSTSPPGGSPSSDKSGSP